MMVLFCHEEHYTSSWRYNYYGHWVQVKLSEGPNIYFYWGGFITDTGDLYLILFPDTYYNDFIWPVVITNIIFKHLNPCNAMDQNNKIQKYEVALKKYWVTQSVYFRLATTVELGMGIIY